MMKIIKRMSWEEYEDTLTCAKLVEQTEKFCEDNDIERENADPLVDIYGNGNREFFVFEDGTILIRILHEGLEDPKRYGSTILFWNMASSRWLNTEDMTYDEVNERQKYMAAVDAQ